MSVLHGSACTALLSYTAACTALHGYSMVFGGGSTHSEISGIWEQGSPNEYKINQIVTVLEIAIGLYLCLRAQGLSNMLRKLREAGAK